MFAGHYGAGFAAKRIESSIPLWVLFLAVQFLDVLWAPFVLLGIEKVRIVPGFTGTNALDLYYMPYTHGLLSSLAWSVACAIGYQLLARPTGVRASVIVGVAVFSHWVLDLIAHVPDLPLYGNTAKVGLGLWNAPVLEFTLEATLLLGGILLCMQAGIVRKGSIALGIVILAIQGYNTFVGPPPTSDKAFAITAIIAYALFAAAIWWLEDRVRRE